MQVQTLEADACTETFLPLGVGQQIFGESRCPQKYAAVYSDALRHSPARNLVFFVFVIPLTVFDWS